MTERNAHLAASQTAAYVPLLSVAAPSKPTPPSVPPASPSGPQAGPSTLEQLATSFSAIFRDPIGT